MFSFTSSLLASARTFNRVGPFTGLVPKIYAPDRHAKNIIFGFCTSNPSKNEAIAPERRPSKVPLEERIRGLRQKARPFALPNLISASRLALTPVTGYLIMNNMHSYAMVCIAAAAMTDIADKIAAKMLNYKSDIFVKLDYVADKAFVVTAMICLSKIDVIPFWLLKGVIMREIAFVLLSLIIRYASLGENPTVRKYFDLHNYPMAGMEPNISGRILTGSQYSLCAYYLYLASLGLSPSGWFLHSFEVFTALMTISTGGFAYVRLANSNFMSRPINL